MRGGQQATGLAGLLASSCDIICFKNRGLTKTECVSTTWQAMCACPYRGGRGVPRDVPVGGEARGGGHDRLLEKRGGGTVFVSLRMTGRSLFCLSLPPARGGKSDRAHPLPSKRHRTRGQSFRRIARAVRGRQARNAG